LKKAIFIILLIQATVFTAKAQLGYNYAQYSMGFGMDYVKASTSVPNQLSYPAFHFSAGYNVSPYTNFSLEYQFGTLSGGFDHYYAKAVAALDPKSTKYDSLLNAIPLNYQKTDPYELNYTNHFQMINLHADVQVGEVFDLSQDSWTHYLNDIYVGSGIGMVFNNISDNHARLSPDSSYYIGGLDKSQNIVVPIRIGYQYKIYNSYDEPAIVLELGYQYNYVLGYGLDGFADPVVVHQLETYSGFHFNIKFNFGSVTSYRKALH
jgi:hypothetical protein